jgi:predicted ATPase
VDGVSEIVGRDAELEMVRSVLTSLPGGPRALLLEGQAGIGKTALWRAALAEAGANDIRVLSCVADQAEAGLAFVGLGDLVRDVLDNVRVSLSDPQREALEIALLERRSSSGPPPDAKTAGVALRALLVELSRGTPVVVAVDDVQWLDAETARALAFAVRRLSGLPVGVLATVRVPHAVSDVLGLERALGPGLSRVRLEALSLGALRALLALRLGYSYPRPVLVRIADTSGGNPLFALEIARALGPSPSLQAGAPLPVPESLRELVVDRLAALPSSARTSLLVASALSHPRIELVERCSSSSGLNAAEEAGLLRTEDGRVIFTHPLYASAVYSSAATGHRRELHRRLADLASEP